MKAQTVDVKSSSGRILCCTIFRSSGKKLLAKGHLISDDDIRILESEGMDKVWVTELEDGEVSEDDAVATVAGEMGCCCYDLGLAAGERANLHSTEYYTAASSRMTTLATPQPHVQRGHRDSVEFQFRPGVP